MWFIYIIIIISYNKNIIIIEQLLLKFLIQDTRIGVLHFCSSLVRVPLPASPAMWPHNPASETKEAFEESSTISSS